MKKTFAIFLALWLGGAFVTSVYFELKLKADCIKEEGLFKGLFWCEKAKPMLHPAGYVMMQTNFFVRGLAWPYFLFLDSEQKNDQRQSGAWVIQLKGTPFTIGSELVISEKDSLKAILLVHFNPKNYCKPELSLLLIANNQLGNFESRDTSSTRMQISTSSVNKKYYQSVFNKYSSGFEYAIQLDDALMSEMKANQTILVAPSNTEKNWTFPLDEFQVMATNQYTACKNH